jgi:hypothetical protein
LRDKQARGQREETEIEERNGGLMARL